MKKLHFTRTLVINFILFQSKIIDIPAVLQKTLAKLSNIVVSDDQRVIVPTPLYFERLVGLLSEFNSTELANHLSMPQFWDFAGGANGYLQSMSDKFNQVLTGIKVPPPRKVNRKKHIVLVDIFEKCLKN